MRVYVSIGDKDYMRVVAEDGGVVLEVTPYIEGLNKEGRIHPPYTPMRISLSASKAADLYQFLGPQPVDGPQENA